MNKARLIFVVTLAIVAIACSGRERVERILETSIQTDLVEFAETETSSLSADVGVRIVPEPDWPQGVSAMGAKEVVVRPEGVYIKISEFFVQEQGVFILPPTSSFVPKRGGDPSYSIIKENLYWYEIKG